MQVAQFLESNQLNVIEGHLALEQKKMFIQRLSESGPIHSVLEIGLNAGHSAEVFLENLPHLKYFISCDIGWHPYTRPVAEFFTKKYEGKFFYLEGDSGIVLPKLADSLAKLPCDLIYIDGCHTYLNAFFDILNAKIVAHKNTILWIDDYDQDEVKKAVDTLVMLKKIKILNQFQTTDADGAFRFWVEARFCDDD